VKQDNGLKCRRGKTVNGSHRDLKSDAEKKTKTGDSSDTDIKFSQAAEPDSPAHQVEPASSELASERMWEDVSDASELSDFSSSYSDLSSLPATTRVTVVGNGLIQVSPADPLICRFLLGSDESKTSMGTNGKTSDDLYNHRSLLNSYGEVVSEQEWEQSVEDLSVSLTDVDGHPHHLVQLQNILPLFIFGMNSDGSRSVQHAAIGDHKLNSDCLSPCQTAGSVNTTVPVDDNLPRNNHLLPKSTSGQVFELTIVAVNYDNNPYFLYFLLQKFCSVIKTICSCILLIPQ